MQQVLNGHTSPETAYVVQDYPYGFRLRCKIRYWIETHKTYGQRFVAQTTNPKKPGEVWNKPKAGTYSIIVVMYLNDDGHVENTGLNPYSGKEDVQKFVATFGSLLDDSQKERLTAIVNAHKKVNGWE